MADTQIEFNLCESIDQLASVAAQRILTTARNAIAARGRFCLALAGGRTPLNAYTLLVDEATDWDRWHIFFGDERCLGPDDPERNSRAADQHFLSRVPIPAANVHPIPAELGAEAAAAAYAELIASQLPLDLVLLGLGEDGHTASLFPGREIPEGVLVMPVHHAPKPPPDRVSLTPDAIASSRQVLVLVTGADKREALAQWRAGKELPIARIRSEGRVQVLMDAAAAGGSDGCPP
ncbi:6-phosphogluconolactonase [Thiorhodococcus mannitoliphagus]|uniref:6-phosphogluconolactonase n=1 Tax=Thiorhodococcus mannitoliphagus TaxID=329406 RepID=A0A6P1DQX6_9GAMM|nr:6-phosphogluconolactonase [Thiorhodococcus mannitoliphagus]NEX20438.1 6-phosphogluconolactonase [Thiorhodococcus mannitoliphagus]